MCKFNYVTASNVLALISYIAIRFMTFPTELLKNLTGAGVSILLSIVVALFIQQVINVDINW